MDQLLGQLKQPGRRVVVNRALWSSCFAGENKNKHIWFMPTLAKTNELIDTVPFLRNIIHTCPERATISDNATDFQTPGATPIYAGGEHGNR